MTFYFFSRKREHFFARTSNKIGKLQRKKRTKDNILLKENVLPRGETLPTSIAYRTFWLKLTGYYSKKLHSQ